MTTNLDATDKDYSDAVWVDGTVARFVDREEWQGMPVAGYRETIEVAGVEVYRTSYHWSTPTNSFERLYTQADVERLLGRIKEASEFIDSLPYVD